MWDWNPTDFSSKTPAFLVNLISRTANSLLIVTLSKPCSLGKYSSTTVTFLMVFSWFKPTIWCFKISATETATEAACPVAFKMTTSSFFSRINLAVYEIYL
jgi:hypothetical protein